MTTNPHPHFPASYTASSLDLLLSALKTVPAYSAWRQHDRGGAVAVDERFRLLPILTKQDLRNHTWQGFIPAGDDHAAALDKGDIEIVQTSGTTAEQLANVWHQPWWDAAERESWRHNSHTARMPLGDHREAILTSPHNTGVVCSNSLLDMARRTRGRFLYLNEKPDLSGWTDEIMRRMLAELTAFSPAVLEANPLYLARLARFAARCGLRPYQPGIIILTYDNPGAIARRQIRRAFTTPMASSYGSTEAGYVLMECEHGALHQLSANCRIDFQPLIHDATIGRLLVSAFNNPWRTLLRFDIGDLARLMPGQHCPCGRNSGYIFSRIVGRTANLTFTHDRLPVTTAEVEDALSPIAGIAEFQLRQRSSARFELTIVPDDSSRNLPGLKDEAIAGMRRTYGPDAEISVAFASILQAEPSGKYRLTRTDIVFDHNDLFAKEC
jgi:phenylacetate-coenzyme A ligase PaaK-like adenylate-forming protein